MDTQFLVEVLVLVFNALGACWMVEMRSIVTGKQIGRAHV